MPQACVSKSEAPLGEMTCRLCGRGPVVREFEARDADNRPGLLFPIFHCRQCHVSFTGESGDGEGPAALYPETYYGEESRANRAAIAVFQALRCRTATRAAPPGRRLLDVGAGNGEFVASAIRRGWDAYGCEPSTVGRAQAEQLGVLPRMFFGTIERLPEHFGTFDLVTLWQSLEHAEDPVSVLSSIHKRLRPRGRVLVSVPNQTGWAFQGFHDQFFHLDVPRHRYHFSPKSLEWLLDRCGFRVVSISHLSLEYSPFGWWQTLLNACGAERNAVYRWLKRGDALTRKRGPARFVSVGMTLLLSIPLLPFSFVLSAIEAAVRRGMIITVTGEKSVES